MLMKKPIVEVINPITYEDWNNLVEHIGGSQIFHSYNWARVLRDTYTYQPYYFCVIEEGRLRALLPLMEITNLAGRKRAVSLPFSDFCSPLIDRGIDPDAFLEAVFAYGREKEWTEVRLRDLDFLSEKAEINTSYFDHVISLNQDLPELFKSIRSNYRSKIKKARKNGLSVDCQNSLEAIEQYYTLHCITRQRHGIPPQPFLLFKKIYEHILFPGLGTVILACKDGVPVSGAVYFHFGGKALYKYGASDPDTFGLNANYLIQWKGMEWALENGCTELSLGRTHRSNEGLLQFKDGWGGERRLSNYYTYDVENSAFIQGPKKESPQGYALLRNMPIPLLRAMGNVLYPHMG